MVEDPGFSGGKLPACWMQALCNREVPLRVVTWAGLCEVREQRHLGWSGWQSWQRAEACGLEQPWRGEKTGDNKPGGLLTTICSK